MSAPDCQLCAQLDTSPAGTAAWASRDDHWAVADHTSSGVPGWFVVQTTRHVESFAELDATEAAQLGDVLRRLAAALHAVTGRDRVYTYSLGETVPHLHVLVGVPGEDAEQRGARFLRRVLERDRSLADPTASRRVRQQVAVHLRASAPALTADGSAEGVSR